MSDCPRRGKRSTRFVFTRFLSISRAIAGQMDYESVLQAVAAEFAHLIHYDHIDVVILINNGNDHLCFEVGKYTMWSHLAKSPKPVVMSPIRAVLQGKAQYLLTADALSDPRFHFEGALDDPIFTAQLRSRIVVPLRVQGKIVGALNISRHRRNCYGDGQVRIAQQCADLIAPYFYAISRAEEARKSAVAEGEARAREQMLRAGALRLTEGMEHERQRIAMDLHDQTMADLARLSRKIARLRRIGSMRGDDLEELEVEVGGCLAELRRIVEDMKPGVLQLFGFSEAVEALIARSTATSPKPIHGVVSDLTDGAPDKLPDICRTALYRIVQEAINNVVRHSRATRLRVGIGIRRSALNVAVSDNGCGLAEPATPASGRGLGNMRMRAELIGARLRVRRGLRGTGTIVSVSLPFGPSGRLASKADFTAALGADAAATERPSSHAGKLG